MSTRLWDNFDGEPFMENPQLGLLTMGGNPKRGKKMAKRRKSRKGRMPAGLKRYWARLRRGRKHAAPRKRKRARENWINSGLVSAVNPRRRRKNPHRRRSRTNPVRRHHYRRNPSLLGIGMPDVKEVLFVGVGFMGPGFLTTQLNHFVPSLTQQISSMGIAGKYILKIGSVVGLTYLVKKFVGAREGNYVLMGGALNVGMSLVNDFAPGILPANPLAMYVPLNGGRQLAAYEPTRPGLRAITRGNRNNQGIPNAAGFGDQGTYGTPHRYFRY